MAKVPTIKGNINSDITTKVAINSISPPNVGNNVDAVVNEVRDRALPQVANDAAAILFDPNDSIMVITIDAGAIWRWNGLAWVKLTTSSGGMLEGSIT
jgi:hypothetical protein